MASVTFDVDVGGDGSTVTDDSNATTGLAGGGHRVRFVPSLVQVVNVAQNTVDKAVEAANTLVAANIAAANAAAAQVLAEAAAATATTGVAFPDTAVVVKGSADASKGLRFEVDGFTTGATRTLTAPNFDGTISTLSGTETLLNKTLTSPSISNPTMTGSVYQNGAVRGAIGTVAALSVTCSTANFFKKTVSSATAFTFDSVPAGDYSFTLEINHTAGSFSFPASVDWSNNRPPTFATGCRHLVHFETSDGGTNWLASAQPNFPAT